MNSVFYTNKTYTPLEIDEVLNDIREPELSIKNNKRIQYYKIPCGFDIETSSFMVKNDKRAIMYEWTFGIDGHIIIGRKWEEFLYIIDKIKEHFKLDNNIRLLVGVHNLAFEFQFMRKWFKWDKVFSIDRRKPVYAITDGIEFRCTYILTNLSLEKVAEDILFKWDIKKDVGDLDYSKIRNSKTPLSEKELQYCIDDVKIVMALMEEKSIQDKGYENIPLTKTAYVRNRCRAKCFGADEGSKSKKYNYQRIMKTLTLTEDDYMDLRMAFQGGFTHANLWRVKDINRLVASYDFTSSYPAVLLMEKYPVSKPYEWKDGLLDKLRNDSELFEIQLKNKCCLFTIKFIGLKEKFIYEHYLSKSKCKVSGKYKIDNGRIIEADEVITTITEQDYFIIQKCYQWDSMEILKFKTFVKGYLPTDFIKTIIELYKMKTELKGVEGKEVEYMNAKGDLNSLYGMCVMDIVREKNEYDDDWVPEDAEPDIFSQLKKYNNNNGRFLYYPWGVWCTAYARRNLFSGIFEFGEDYVYSDTDSIKVVNAKNHLDYFYEYTKEIEHKLDVISKYHEIPIEEFKPKTIKGKEKLIGVWDYEGTYGMFKTLGAKRYLVTHLNKQYKDEIQLTVSGLNKAVVVPYLNKMFGLKKSRTYSGRMRRLEKLFNFFDEGLYIPPEYTGKLTHTYLDNEQDGYVTDYLGNKAHYHEKSSIHLSGSDYTLSIANEYMIVIMDILKLKIREDY